MSLINETDKYIFSTYKRFPIVLIKGKGTKVWDQDGKEYLDFVTGLAVCSLGHCHPKVVEAIEAQAKTLLHVSNLFHIKPQIELARLLVENSFCQKRNLHFRRTSIFFLHLVLFYHICFLFRREWHFLNLLTIKIFKFFIFIIQIYLCKGKEMKKLFFYLKNFLKIHNSLKSLIS